MTAIHGVPSFTHHGRWGSHGAASVDRGAREEGAWASSETGGRDSSIQVRSRVDAWEPSGAAASSRAGHLPSGVHRFSVDLGAAALAATSLDSLATTIVDTVGDVLGITSDDLAGRVASGESLNAIATATNTPHNDLAAMVRAALPDALSAPQAGALTEQLTSATWPPASNTVQLDEATDRSLG